MMTSSSTTHHQNDASSCSSIMIVVLEILGHIEQGAALIVDKQYKQAGISLTRALQMNKEILASEIVLHEETQGIEDEVVIEDACSSSSLLCGQVLDLVILTSKWCEGQQNKTTPDSQEGAEKDDYYQFTTSRRSMYAHSAPLVLRPCDQLFALIEKIPRQEFQLALSLIIIFNLALSQHLYGICQLKKRGGSACCDCSSTFLLARACALYGYSYTLLHQLELGGTCSFLGLVIVNNEAQVLSIMGKHHEAEELLQVILLAGLCYLNDLSLGHNVGFLPMSSLFLDGLVHNISQLILKDVTTASAA